MRYYIYIVIALLSFFNASYGQHISTLLPSLIARYDSNDIGQGEYQILFKQPSTKLVFGSGNISNIGVNGVGTQGIVYQSIFSPTTLKHNFVAGGLHGAFTIDTTMHVWGMGENFYYNYGIGNNNDYLTPQKVLTDSAGNDFDSCVQIIPYFKKINGGGSIAGYNGAYVIRYVDGIRTLWGCGMMLGGMRTNGTDGISADTAVKRWVQMEVPSGREPLIVVCENIAIMLCTDGTVWVLGNASNSNLGYTMTGMQYASWHQLSGLSNIKSVAAGKNFHHAVTCSGDTTYGWGQWGNYMADGTFTSGGGAAISTPTRLTNIDNNLPAPIDRIMSNDVATFAILTDSTLWGWGGNSEGTIGIGTERDWSAYACNLKYAWDNTLAVGEKVRFPTQIMKGKKFINVYGSAVYTFYTYAKESNGDLYAWGRNKGSVIADGVRGANSTLVAGKQSSWDRYWPVKVTPFNQTSSYAVTSPACIIDGCTGSPCNTYTETDVTDPVANAGSNQSISTTTTILNGTLSTDNTFIQRYVWRQVDGPTTVNLDAAGNPTVNVSGMTDGTYNFELVTTDKGWRSKKDTVQVVVNTSTNLPPTCSAGSNQTVTLPTASVNLSASDSDPDGTISSRLWTIDAAPGGSTADFSNNAIVNPSFSTMIEGNYTLKYTVTDNNSAVCSSLVNITVNPAPANDPPVADAGATQEITLPVDVVVVSAAGSTDSDGTIVSYLWEQVDENDPANILSPTSVSTTINNLKAGTYNFRVTVTDDDGATSQATVTIIVHARWAFNSNGRRFIFGPRN
jgi:alpha-tubulin suppressor-like RCC1 family protein